MEIGNKKIWFTSDTHFGHIKDFLWSPRGFYSIQEHDEAIIHNWNEVIKTFIDNIDKSLINEEYCGDVYADATHLSPKSRAQVLNKLKNKDKVSVIYLDIPLNIILERNAQRKGRALVPENVVRRMYNSIILPTKAEGIEELIIIDENQKVKEVIKLWFG